MVLGRRTDHAGPADVDILDHLVAAGALHHRRLERVEVDHDQVDRADGVLGHGCGMLWIVAHRQQPAVDLGVQRLDPAVHHLGKAGQLGNIHHRQPRIAQGLGGAAGRNQLYPARGKGLAQFHQPGLVGHRKQRPADRNVRHWSSIPFSSAARQSFPRRARSIRRRRSAGLAAGDPGRRPRYFPRSSPGRPRP